MSALRFNEGKPELSYILSMPRAMKALAKVFSQGAIKYERNNWLKGGKPDEEYKDSLLRHLFAMEKGELYDPDTGCLHAAHAMWNLGALIELNYGPIHDEKTGIGREAYPVFNPGFDQQSFIDQYRDRPKMYTPSEMAAPIQFPSYPTNKENTSK